MKKIVGICMLAAASVIASQAYAENLDVPVEGASRWSSSVMDRHMPVDSAQLQKLGQKKFRYMDMAQSKRSKSIRNAVIVHGPSAQPKGAPQEPVYRNKAEASRPLVILRPMT